MSDLISRQAAIEAIRNIKAIKGTSDDKILLIDKAEAQTELMMLPSAQPEPCEDTVSRQRLLSDLKELVAAWKKYPVMAEQIKGVEAAIGYVELIPSAQPEQRWIPVSERLPEPRVDVWVNSDIGQIQGYYEEHVGVWYASFGQGRDYLELIVNAWMPLPEPYREGEQDE